MKECVSQVALEYRNTILKSSARNSYLERKVERIADRTIRALIHQLRKGDFEPEEFEVDVSTRIPLRGGETLNLRGRIDRMDILEEEDRVLVKIMDYKSGSTSFDLVPALPWTPAPAGGLYGRGPQAGGKAPSREKGSSRRDLLLSHRRSSDRAAGRHDARRRSKRGSLKSSG